MPLTFAHSQEEIKSLAPSLSDPETGAQVRFSGTVRKINHEKAVDYLFYEAYTQLAISHFLAIEAAARKKFAITFIKAVHLLGRACAGEVAVVIEVFAKHRAPAFLAARFIMDELKSSLPIWKCEYYEDGTKSWDQGLCQCAPDSFRSLEPVKKALRGQNMDPDIIAQKKVLLVGAGGLGCPLAINLSALGIKSLAIFDGDDVNITNLARQFMFKRSDVGLNKAQLMAEYLKERFSSLIVSAHDRMMDEENADAHFTNFDLVVDASDSMPTKIMLAHYARIFQVPFISASVYQAEGEVTAIHPADFGGCFSCFRRSKLADNCANTGIFTHTCFLVAAKASALALDFLVGKVRKNCMNIVHAAGFLELAINKDPQCFQCSSLKISNSSMGAVNQRPRESRLNSARSSQF
jgi:molybdopterin/thiamine biosynthesis adenylyltransferase/molybdopterin synthase catalytic subunit